MSYRHPYVNRCKSLSPSDLSPFHDRGTVFRNNNGNTLIKTVSNGIVDIGPNVLFDSNTVTLGPSNAGSAVFMGLASTINWAWYVVQRTSKKEVHHPSLDRPLNSSTITLLTQ